MYLRQWQTSEQATRKRISVCCDQQLDTDLCVNGKFYQVEMVRNKKKFCA